MEDTAPDRDGVAAVAADLMFASKIRAAAQQAGVAVSFARNPEDLRRFAAASRLVLLDLETRWLDPQRDIAGLRAAPETAEVPVVGFVSHVNATAIAAAREAGARVLARSAFVRALPELLSSL